MATLAADGVPPQPPHPTMPPYASRETDLHSNELSFQVERPRKPKIWEITNPSTQSHAEPTHHPTTTMETTKTPASHATALPPLSSLPTASVSNHWQDNRLKIANVLDRTDVNTQHQTKRGLRKPPDNQRQPLTTLPQDSLTNPNDIGQHDDSQCPISGDKPVQRNNILQQITTTPNLAHAANMTPSYTKIPEKVTLHLPQHQSTHYNNIITNQTATETITITTTAFHQNAHSRTTNDSTRPTHHSLPIPTTTASAALASTTSTLAETPIQQENSQVQPDRASQQKSQTTTASPQHAPVTPNGSTDMTTGLFPIHDLLNDTIPHTQLTNHDNWAQQNPSQSITLHDLDNSNQPPPSHPILQMQQHFNVVFWALQQQIQEQHLMLERKIQSFLEFFEQQHNNLSQTAPTTARNTTIDTRYSCPAIFKYFFDVYCSPTLPDTHWYHRCNRRSNSQNIPSTTCTFYSTIGRQPPNKEHSSELLTMTTV